MNSALKFRKRLSVVGLVLGAILFLAFYFAFQSAGETRRMNFWVNHTQEVLNILADARLQRSRLTNEIWAYRASHDADLPEKFQTDATNLETDVNRLRMLTADNKEQQARAAEMEEALAKQLPFLKQAMQQAASMPEGKSTEPADLPLPIPPSERLSQVFDSMESAEKALLFVRTSKFEINTLRTKEVLFITAALTFLILTGGWYLVQIEVLRRAEVEQAMRRAQALLGVKYEEQGSELSHAVEDLHEQILERQAAEERVRLLNEQLEEKVRERTEELQEMNNELETFSYSVSHDLRAPLRHMEGFSRILQQQYEALLPEEAQHYLKRIRDAASHMSVLVEDLLHLSRIGRQSPQLKNVSLVELVEETKIDALADVSDRNIHWQIDALPKLDADPILLRQVFVNLLSNAVKFTRNQPHALIEIGHNKENGEEVIFVRDNGAGFDPQYADKLFGVFQRLHRQDEFEGTGIGLATVKRIIHKHGGRVWAESQPGQGATFYFSLPSRAKRVQYEKQMMGATA